MAHAWRLTPHARLRSDEMELDRDQVLEVLRDPDYDYPCAAQRYGKDRRIAVKGDLEVVYRKDTKIIISILWNRAHGSWYRQTG